MRKSILATALAAVLVWAGVAGAAPLGPAGLSLATNALGDFTSPFAGFFCGGFSCIAGEGSAPNDNIDGGTMAAPATAVIHVDWIVVHDSNTSGGYTYYYQVENTSIATVTDLIIFSELFQAAGIISGPAGNAGGFDAGTMAGTVIGAPLAGTDPLTFGADTDYALPGHKGPAAGGPFTNLTYAAGAAPGPGDVPGVNDVADGLPVCPACPRDIEIIPASVGELNPGFGAAGNLFVGSASGISIAQGIAPVYVEYQLQGTMQNQWGSVNTNSKVDPATGFAGDTGRAIPGPGAPSNGVPEPGTILLLGSGLVGLGFWARRRLS